MMTYIRSHIDPNTRVTDQRWVVSLVAKSKGENPEHAFLIVEGISQAKETVYYHYRRYDFGLGHGANQNLTLMECKGVVDIKKRDLDCDADVRERIFWNSFMRDDEKEQGCHGMSWRITPEQARHLDDSVEAEQIKPSPFVITGVHGIFPASASQSGHNCYTWARKMLFKIKKPEITDDPRLAVQIGDFFIAARVSKHIQVPRLLVGEPTSPKCNIL